jgi:hypothetical protein
MKRKLNNFNGVFLEVLGETPDVVGWNVSSCRLVFQYGDRIFDGNGKTLYARDGVLIQYIRTAQYEELLKQFDPENELPLDEEWEFVPEAVEDALRIAGLV